MLTRLLKQVLELGQALPSSVIRAEVCRRFAVCMHFQGCLHSVKFVQELAEAYPARQIGAEAYRLFKEFRPSPGQGGAGRMRKGPLRLERLRELAAEASDKAT